MRRDRAIAGVVLLLGLILTPASAAAINYGGVGAKPAHPDPANPRSQSIFIYTLKPGQQAQDGLKVMNNTADPQQIALYAVDSVVSSDGSFGCAQNADPRQAVGAWLQLSQQSVSLAANSSTVVPFTISVPDSKSISVGEHDGCIAIQAASQTATESKQSGVLLSFRTATRVVVTIPGKLVKRLTVTGVSVRPAEHNKLQVSPSIKNSGNVSLDTNLRTKLLSIVGVQAETAQNGTTPVLPQNTTSRNFALPRPFWGGFYRAEVLASYNDNPSVGLGQGEHSDQQTVSKSSGWFFVVPAAAALLIELLVLAALVGSVYWFVVQRRRQLDVRSNWEDYKVKARDTLPVLAEKRGVAWRQLARANGLKPPYHLEKGQTIKLPPKQE